MPNTLGAYNPIFYAQQTLIHLRKVLGMAARVYRGYEQERNATFRMGDTITIRKPSTFTAQNAPSSAQDLATQSVNIVLDQWKEVKFEATDKERAYTGERLIAEHIEPAAYAIGDNIDQALAALYKDIPWISDYGSALDHTIITGARKVLFDNAVPMDNNLHLMVDSTLEMAFLNSQVFHSAQVAGAAAEGPLMRGTLGTRFGIEVFANQNVQAHLGGTATLTAGDKAGTVNGVHAKGATTLAVTGFTGAETIKKGDTLVIAGNTQRYAVAADVTLAAGAGTLTITPGLAAALVGSEVVTLGTAPSDTAHSANLMFHRNAFALAMAPLPDDLPGIEAFTAVDPVSGLSVRARRWADGNSSKLIMALDVLHGVKTLDPNLAVRAST
jgi:P22 coat protein - gene protein 5